MRGALLTLLLLGCEAQSEVIFPDAARADVVISERPAPPDAPASADVTAPDDVVDVIAPQDLVTPADLPSFDPDGGVAPACGALARLEDPAGDYIVVANPDGGRFVVELDAPLRSIGILCAGPLSVFITGAHAGALQRVLVVGPEAESAAVSAATSTRVERLRAAPATLSDGDGVATMTCAAGCDGLRPPRELGCNSRAQVEAFFTARLGKGRRWSLLQRASLEGLRVRVSAGGCCL